MQRWRTDPLPPRVILTAVGIQSLFRAPPCPLQRGNTCCGQAGPFPSPSAPTSRHSHRSGNPEPFPCAAMPITTGKHLLWASQTLPVALRAYLPSFSPQWESRALSVRRHAHYNGETPVVVGKPRPCHRSPRPPTVILTAVGIQSPFRAPPCPLQRGNTCCGQAGPLHSSFAACPWTPEPRQRTKGALDSHCGENDGGDWLGEYCSTQGLMESARPVSTRGAKLKSLPRLHLSGCGPVGGIGIRG